MKRILLLATLLLVIRAPAVLAKTAAAPYLPIHTEWVMFSFDNGPAAFAYAAGQSGAAVVPTFDTPPRFLVFTFVTGDFIYHPWSPFSFATFTDRAEALWTLDQQRTVNKGALSIQTTWVVWWGTE